ncbi:MAG: DUF58 domain-containing protein [Dehalococcoidia bacterium]|nr:DUF58 domain-containing protein [Dehalococcoidia bacterium]
MRAWWPRLWRPRRDPSRPASDEAASLDGATELLRRVRAIELRARRLVDDLFLGEYHAVFRGRGIEFDELRPYVVGDDVRSIDWKSYARTGQPLVRRYREDRDLTVLFAVDVSASQTAGAAERSKASLAAELCAVFALAAIRNNDRAGLLLFASAPERYLRPAGGSIHVLRLVREVLSARPETRGTDLGAALEYLTGVQRRRATLFIISDFLTEGYARALRAAARRFDIIAVRIREPLDEQLPAAGVVRLEDAEGGAAYEVDSDDEAVREAYAARVREIDAERDRLFGELGIDEIAIVTGEDYVRALLAFFRRRARAVA